MFDKICAAVLFMCIGATSIWAFWMATHSCFDFKSEAILCTRHAFDFWSIFGK